MPRFVRVTDGHTYELIVNTVDMGSGPYVEPVPPTWTVHRDGEPVVDRDEAYRLRREHFGEW